MGVISSRIRRHRRTRLAAEMACTWTPRRMFPLGTEQGGVYYPDDPNALLRRVNQLSATATLSTQSITATPRQQTLSFKGTGTVTLSGASTAGPLVGTGAGNRVSLTFTPTAASLTLTVTGTVTEAQLELGSAFTTYQPVTTWTTDYMAAVGHLVTQFTDSAGTTPMTKVTDPVGLTLDRRFGGARGPQLLTSGAIGLTGSATAATYSTTTGAGTVTRVDASNQSWVQFSGLTAGRSYQITVSGVSGGTLQVRDGSVTGTVIASTTSATPCLVTATGTTITLTASAAATVAFTVTQIQWLPGNHRIQATSGSRKTLSARYNRYTQNKDLSNAAWSKINATVTAGGGTAPDGSSVCRVQLGSGSDAYVFQLAMPSAGSFVNNFWVKSNTGGTQVFRLFGDGTLKFSGVLTATTTWQEFSFSAVSSGGTSCGICNVAAFTAADLLVWQGEIRTADDAAKAIPAYQRVNTASDYDTDGFYHANVFDGTDDNDTCATGGGNTSGLMLVSTITVQGGAGTNRVIWSDIGTNTGYRVRINTSNQLEVSAGNGSAFTTIATVATLPVGETHVISAWDDGANLNVQIDNGAIASTARPSVSAGTAGFTVWKENGAASGYFFGRAYNLVHRFSGYNGSEHTRLKQWAARLAGVTI